MSFETKNSLLLCFLTKPSDMDKNVPNNDKIAANFKKTIKRNIARAWYNLDQQSYEKWLEGRRVSKSELKY